MFFITCVIIIVYINVVEFQWWHMAVELSWTHKCMWSSVSHKISRACGWSATYQSYPSDHHKKKQTFESASWLLCSIVVILLLTRGSRSWKWWWIPSRKLLLACPLVCVSWYQTPENSGQC